MARKSCFSFLIVCLLIAGCQTAPVVSDSVDVSEAPKSANVSEQTSAVETSKPATAPATRPARTDNIEYLSGQLSTMQEQIIQIKADTFELKQTSQVLLARLQMQACNF